MVFARAKQSFIVFTRRAAGFVLIPLVLQSCTGNKNVYESNCSPNISFKKVDFSRLIVHIKDYDHQYVEIAGTYIEDKEKSALYNDSLFTDHSDKHALWVNFSQDCPLYLKGTRTGLFEATDDGFTNLNNKKMIIRGIIDVHNTGHQGLYKASLDRVSYIEL